MRACYSAARSFYWEMDFKLLRLFLLLAVALAQIGCASTKDSADNNVAPLEPVPSQDDSHGWGANLQNVSR
jgi:hypothetical protein